MSGKREITMHIDHSNIILGDKNEPYPILMECIIVKQSEDISKYVIALPYDVAKSIALAFIKLH